MGVKATLALGQNGTKQLLKQYGEQLICVRLDKNRKWVANLHKSIDQLSVEQKASIMKHAGENCANDLLKLCESFLGRQII